MTLSPRVSNIHLAVRQRTAVFKRCQKMMKLPRRPICLLGFGVLLLSTFFFGAAAVGWQREKHDVRVIRAEFREREAKIRSAIDELGEGVSLETFNELLPNAYYDKEDEEWIVWIPTGYDENPACTNTYTESKYFRLDGSLVRPVEFKSGVGGMHGDRFGPGGVWYYFWRAWYSSAEHHKAPSRAEQ